MTYGSGPCQSGPVTTYGVLGVGSIATSIVTGLCAGVAEPLPVVLSPRNVDRATELAQRFPTVTVANDNQAVIDASDVVLLCVLPDHADDVLSALHFRADQSVVSAISGVCLSTLRRLVSPATDIARSVPVPSVAHRGSVTPVYPRTVAAVAFYERLGGVLPTDDEVAYEALTVASATVAAHFDYLRAVSDWLAGHGLSEPQARRYVADHFAALTGELQADDVDFSRLGQAHSTPGGLNEQFARHLASIGTEEGVHTGLDALLQRVIG